MINLPRILIAEQLQQLRQERGYSQLEVAQAVADLDVATLSRLENAMLDVTLPQLMDLAMFYGVDVSSILADVYHAD